MHEPLAHLGPSRDSTHMRKVGQPQGPVTWLEPRLCRGSMLRLSVTGPRDAAAAQDTCADEVDDALINYIPFN